jgi:hypothetical protein
MTVEELMTILEDMDPDAEVVMVFQENWPLEYALGGVALRSDAEGRSDDERDPDAPPRSRRPDDGAPNDVILVEGRHLRYGNRNAWEVAVRE